MHRTAEGPLARAARLCPSRSRPPTPLPPPLPLACVRLVPCASHDCIIPPPAGSLLQPLGGSNVFAAAPRLLPAQLAGPPSPWLMQIAADSTKRKRTRKMNKHKYRKLRKKLRLVTKVNIKSS